MRGGDNGGDFGEIRGTKKKRASSVERKRREFSHRFAFCSRPTIYFVALQEIAIASALLEPSLVLSGPLAHRVMYPGRLLRHAAPIRTCARVRVGVRPCVGRAIVWMGREMEGTGRGVSAGALRWLLVAASPENIESRRRVEGWKVERWRRRVRPSRVERRQSRIPWTGEEEEKGIRALFHG